MPASRSHASSWRMAAEADAIEFARSAGVPTPAQQPAFRAPLTLLAVPTLNLDTQEKRRRIFGQR